MLTNRVEHSGTAFSFSEQAPWQTMQRQLNKHGIRVGARSSALIVPIGPRKISGKPRNLAV